MAKYDIVTLLDADVAEPVVRIEAEIFPAELTQAELRMVQAASPVAAWVNKAAPALRPVTATVATKVEPVVVEAARKDAEPNRTSAIEAPPDPNVAPVRTGLLRKLTFCLKFRGTACLHWNKKAVGNRVPAAD